MRTITTTYNIYKYHELSDNAKQKVKDWYLSDIDRAEWFYEDLNCHLDSLFGENHNLEIQYSLSYRQGDGVNIYGSIHAYNIIEHIQNYRTDVLTKEEVNTIFDYAYHTFEITLPINRNYCYCLADRIEFAYDWEKELEYAEVENIDTELIKKFENVVKDIFSSLCAEYEEDGYKYFYEISDEEMQELCEANEWEFYKDGTLYY